MTSLHASSHLIRLSIASAFLFFTFLLSVKNVSAATITVDALTNTGGAGCELREAILSANTDAAVGGCTSGASGSDTINFTGSGTIDISNQNLPNINSIVIMDGGDDIVIDAFNTSSRRIFTLSGTTSTTFTLSNITLQNGSSTNGGCISMEDAPDRSLTLDDVDFIWCTASGNGGAVYVPNGTANLLITDSTFTSSSAVTAGGALWAGSGTFVTSTGVTAFRNRAPAGGAFFFSSVMTSGSESLYISDSTFESNTSTQTGNGGAGVFSGKRLNTVVDSIFKNNITTAAKGGALSFFLRYVGSASVSSSTFTNNLAQNDGSAIYFRDGAFQASDISFVGNQAAYGAVGFEGGIQAQVTRSLFSANGNSTGIYTIGYGESSAISNYATGTLEITNSTFNQNTSTDLGTILAAFNAATTTLYNNTFYNNKNLAGGFAAAIVTFQAGSDAFIANNIFEGNTSAGVTSNCVAAISGTVISRGGNLFDSVGGCTAISSDLTSSTAQLGPLQDNGGPTLTRLPADNSVAVNAANSVYAPAVDQRNFARPQGAGYDIGAVDISDATAPVLAIVTPVSTPQGDLTPDFSFSTTEAGTLSYPGTCSSVTVQATSGTNAITFNTLTTGTRYDNCQVRLTDSSGNATTLTLTTFETTGAPGSSGGSSGGGGGLGSAGTVAIPPVTTQFQTNLQNLQNQGVSVHGLIKIPSNSAVYYIGSDGKRHAFPNDKVYFTWYENFDGVQLVNEAQLSSIPLGKNVTYKPGKKMVKFTTDNKVYVVAKGGILRWVTTEAAATALYGNSWNMQIDDISDAFYTNYTFGQNVTELMDFNPTTVQASVQFPSDSLEM